MTLRPSTRIWYRNPLKAMRQLAELRLYNTVWDAGYVWNRHNFDVSVKCRKFFGADAPWNALFVDDALVTHWQASSREPVAVYPTWNARSESWSKLDRLMREPWGRRPQLYGDTFLDIRKRPIKDQPHVIVMKNPPPYESRNYDFYENLRDFVEEREELGAKLFLHGSYSYPLMFGGIFNAADFDPITAAARRELILPVGPRVRAENMVGFEYWFELLGFRRQELNDAGKCCSYNILSADWASRYYNTAKRFAIKTSRDIPVWANPELESWIKENSSTFHRRIAPQPGDKVVCDDCSLWMGCKLFREGAVCAVPGSDMVDVAKLFGTRNSGEIQKGLAKLIGVNAKRAEKAIDKEEEEGEIDPNLNKLMEALFKQGVELAKIVDPTLRAGGTKVAVNIGQASGVAVGAGDDSRGLAARAIQELEARGFTREQITPEILRNWIIETIGDEATDKLIVGQIEA